MRKSIYRPFDHELTTNHRYVLSTNYQPPDYAGIDSQWYISSWVNKDIQNEYFKVF